MTMLDAATQNAASALSPDEARNIDTQIDSQIITCGQNLLANNMALAALLRQMHDGEGYRALNFKTWREYLDTKHDFGRTYLGYLLKLGQAGELKLDAYPEMSSSLLVSYAKMTDFPAKIPELIAATWDQVKGQSVRVAEHTLSAFVAANASTYKKHHKPASAQKHDWLGGFEKQFSTLSTDEQADFLKEMWAFMEKHDGGQTPSHS